MSKNTKKLVPKLRFPEFRDTDEWQPEILTKIFHFQDGFAFKSTDFVECGEETIQVIRITDINNKNSNADKVFAPKHIIGTLKLEKYIISDGDLLLSLTGAAGFNFFFWNGSAAVLNQRTCKITPKNKSNVSLPRLLEPLIYEKINSKGEGQNNNLSKEFLNEIEIPVPDPKEQQKIANCLSSIDDLINAQSQKIEALKTHKKGLMQQLFPSEGETVPRLRFPEFRNAGEWEEKALGQVAKYENGKAHEQDIADSGKFVVVNSKFISTEGDVRKYTNSAFCVAEKNDILMVLSDIPNGRAIAKCFLVDADNRYTVNQRICRLRPHKAVSLMLFYVLNRNSYFLAFDDGVKQTNLKKDDVLDCPVLLPKDPEEQQKIADMLSNIDELINSQNQRLETLKTHKKGLMQQLFPAMDETKI